MIQRLRGLAALSMVALAGCTLSDVVAAWGVAHYVIDQQCDAAHRYDAASRHALPLPAGRARLVVFRPASFVASGVRPELHLDGRPLGALNAGQVAMVDIPAGAHRLDGEGEALSFSVAEGDTRIVRATPETGFWNGWLRLTALDATQSADEFATLCLHRQPDLSREPL